MIWRQIQSLIYATAIGSTLAFAPSPRRPSSVISDVRGYHHHNDEKQLFINNSRIGTCLAMSDGGADTNDGEQGNNNNNFLNKLMTNVMQIASPTAETKPTEALIVETEEEKQKRLRLERLAEIEAGEVRRQARVAEDKFGYLFLFALQLLPLLGSDRVESILYFFGVAVTTVYLGGRQEVIDAPERVSKDNALYAPIG